MAEAADVYANAHKCYPSDRKPVRSKVDLESPSQDVRKK